MNIRESISTGWIEYDYAVVRIVPKVHLCTFINIGVVVHSRVENFLDARIEIDRERLQALCAGLDIRTLERYAEAYLRVCRGGSDAGPIGLLPPSERFHWLTAPRSAVLQTSEVHPGRCRDLPETLERLFHEQCQ